jgi:lipoprotein-anchoring transpeptidase ErfK/SrfK
VRPTARSINGDGIVAEVDKTRQLLLYTRDGRVEWVFNTSTGSGERYISQGRWAIATTPEGKWPFAYAVNGEDDGPLGELWRPRYFVDGYAIHGSPSVPGYPASHGCGRVANPVIDFIWDTGMLPLHTSFVWIYS